MHIKAMTHKYDCNSLNSVKVEHLTLSKIMVSYFQLISLIYLIIKMCFETVLRFIHFIRFCIILMSVM